MKGPTISQFSKPSEQLVHLKPEDLPPLPPPFDDVPEMAPLTDKMREGVASTLDDTIALNIPEPETEAEKEALIQKFLSGFEKLLTKENNWTFLQPLTLSLDHCAKCQTCAEACPIFEMSGGNELYRPTLRAEILRRIQNKYMKPGGKITAKLVGDIDLNWTTLSRLFELAYRCTICRRCAQTCPIGCDNGLITHELRKIFSMEMGIAPKEIHDQGSVLQLKVGSSTGMNAEVVKDNIEFIDEDMFDITGIKVETKWDVEGADVLLIHNAGEILAWPENPGAFAIILEAAGISWTLSSEGIGYDGINYGLWYDDAQFARVAVRHAEAAKKLGVKKIVIGECGHAHKALSVIADRVLTGEANIPRESAMTLLHDIVMNDRIKLDPSKNDFPVTLHDPCNLTRLMGVVEPQREILRKIAPQFREMEPHGTQNYCCGGGSGFAIMNPNNFADWRFHLNGRKKMQQFIGAFEDCLGPEVPKYLCAPCSNCKGMFRDLFRYYNVFEKTNTIYGGLVELIVNAMVDIKEPFLKWDYQ